MDFVDLYCGVGGLSLGLTDAGMTPVAAFDHWVPALEIYRRNIGNHAAQADLAQPWHVIPRIKRLRPDLIVGGPPCQDFSAAGNRTEGNRAALTVRFAQIVVSVAALFLDGEHAPHRQQESLRHCPRTFSGRRVRPYRNRD